MNGKSKCKILKDIRRQIAADNDIEFVTSECKYQGDCAGTCPKCEAEVRYLERELEKRQQVGKAVAVAGIAATIMVSTAGCMPFDTTMGDMLPPSQTSPSQGGETVPGGIDYVEPTTLPTTPATTLGEITMTEPPPPMGVPVDWD